jgi:uncharacterized protein (TIGR02117 family)
VRRLRRALAVVLAVAAALVLALAAAAVVTARPGDPALFPPHGEAPVQMFVVSSGYHAGLGIRREDLAALARDAGLPSLIAVATRFAAYEWLEIGWGEERFYRTVPQLGDLSVGLALSALFAPGNGSVLHVVGLDADPGTVFPDVDVVPVPLSRAGAVRLAALLERTFARGAGGMPEVLGPGLYGPSLFYRAVGSFSLRRVCNHWLADLLDAAGVPTTPVLATVPPGLLWDLELRSGLKPLRR